MLIIMSSSLVVGDVTLPKKELVHATYEGNPVKKKLERCNISGKRMSDSTRKEQPRRDKEPDGSESQMSSSYVLYFVSPQNLSKFWRHMSMSLVLALVATFILHPEKKKEITRPTIITRRIV